MASSTITHKVVIGVDEAGRGCMWGSVFAGAVILPQELTDEERLTKEEAFLLRDSKKLSDKRRNEAAALVYKRSLGWGVGESTSDEIDQWNILQATQTAMHRAIRNCIRMLKEKETETVKYEVTEILVDGNYFRMFVDDNGEMIPHSCVIGGDASNRSIAAASILAKTSRDNHVLFAVDSDPDLDIKWGMKRHKGYCTRDHMNALEIHGIHPMHRKSYGPVKKYL